MPDLALLPRSRGGVLVAMAVLAVALAACSPRASTPAPAAAPRAAAAAPAPAPVPDASPPGRVGRLADLSPGVQRFGVDQYEPAVRNEPFSTGDRLATEEGGHAVLEIGSTTVRLGPATLVVAARLDDEAVRLRLDHGEMTLDVRSPAHARDIAVETADGFFVPQQPSFVHVAVEGGHSFGATWRGVLRFEARDGTQMDLKPGQRTENWREGPTKAAHFEWVAMPASPFAARAQKDDAAEEQARAGASHVPAEMTGGAALAGQGRWQADAGVPGGWVWEPPVRAGWTPFRDGRWAWVPPWGWTWVDAAPWGFAPSHYGRWTSRQGRWAWAPGEALPGGTSPAFAPATVAWLGLAGDAPAASPPSVAWTPLAPGEPVFVAAALTRVAWLRLDPGIPWPAREAPATAVRLVPAGPARLAHLGAGAPKDAISVATAASMQPWQPVVLAPAAQRAAWQRAAAQGRLTWQGPPPPPAGRGAIDESLPGVTVTMGTKDVTVSGAGASSPAAAASTAGSSPR